MNTEYKAHYIEPNAAEWVDETYIADDTQALTARANERWLHSIIELFRAARCMVEGAEQGRGGGDDFGNW